jgi:hypothetical protein
MTFQWILMIELWMFLWVFELGLASTYSGSSYSVNEYNDEWSNMNRNARIKECYAEE